MTPWRLGWLRRGGDVMGNLSGEHQQAVWCGDSPAGFTSGRERTVHEETRLKLGSARFYYNWYWTKTSRVWPRSFFLSHHAHHGLAKQHTTLFEESI